MTKCAVKNVNLGTREVFRFAMQWLKKDFIIRRNGRIAVRTRCPDCGVAGGEPHECDVQQCSVCNRRSGNCKCVGHDHGARLWLGRTDLHTTDGMHPAGLDESTNGKSNPVSHGPADGKMELEVAVPLAGVWTVSCNGVVNTVA